MTAIIDTPARERALIEGIEVGIGTIHIIKPDWTRASPDSVDHGSGHIEAQLATSHDRIGSCVKVVGTTRTPHPVV